MPNTMVDASIPLQVQQPQFLTPWDLEQFRGQIYNNQFNQLRLQEAQRAIQSQNVMSRLMGQQGAYDPSGNLSPEVLQQMAAAGVSPKDILALRNQMAEQQQQRARLNETNQKAILEKVQADQAVFDTRIKKFQPLMQSMVSRYEELLKKGEKDPNKAVEDVEQYGLEQIKQMESSGQVTKDEADWARGYKFNPAQFRATLMQQLQKEGLTKPQQPVEYIKGGTLIQKRYDPITGEEIEVGRGPRSEKGAEEKFSPVVTLEVKDKEGKVQKFEAQQNKQTGRWVTADERRAPIDVSKGYKIVKESSLGGREEVLITRGITSAMDAVADIENMSALPVQATTGWFGMGHQVVSPSLVNAPRTALLNKMTPEEDQSLQVSIKGIGRALAGLATGGVYVNQAIVQQFDALAAQPGDTYAVKLQKLATMRQNADNAVKALLANPRLGEDQKVQLQEVLDRLKTAVPYLPKDVIAYMNSGRRSESFEDYAARKGVGKPAGPAGAAGRGEGAETAPARQPTPTGPAGAAGKGKVIDFKDLATEKPTSAAPAAQTQGTREHPYVFTPEAATKIPKTERKKNEYYQIGDELYTWTGTGWRPVK